jgi:hypothetical protein
MAVADADANRHSPLSPVLGKSLQGHYDYLIRNGDAAPVNGSCRTFIDKQMPSERTC